jgi:predicted transposase YbfD/YdcC
VKADYLFSLKGNQGSLHDEGGEYFEPVDFKKPEAGIQVATTHEVDHRRIERRTHAVTDDGAWLIARHPLWKSIKSIVGKRGNA